MTNPMPLTCTIRPDLLRHGLGVPVGDIYYFDSDPIQYRWIGEMFQVLVLGQWLEAYSIDFDF